MVPRRLLPPEGVVDIFAVHTRLNPSEHRKILHPDTVFVTIVRDPSLLFESLYSYYHLGKYFDGAPLEEFLNFPLQVKINRWLGRTLILSLSLLMYNRGPRCSSSINPFLCETLGRRAAFSVIFFSCWF